MANPSAALTSALATFEAALVTYLTRRPEGAMPDLTFAAPAAVVGETYEWTPTIIDPVTGVVPNPDLSTYAAAEFDVRVAPGSATILQASISNGKLTLGAFGTGQFTVTFQPSDVTAAGAYTWECRFVDSTGNVSKPFGGQFMIQQTFSS
jgi:hypothetical protein